MPRPMRLGVAIASHTGAIEPIVIHALVHEG